MNSKLILPNRFALRRRLLWVDCIAGGVVGVVMLLAVDWLTEWYRLPRDFVLLMGAANLAYACYSFTLATRKRRPMALLALLVFANLAWAALCLRWAVLFGGVASVLGLAHLVCEGVFVGGLALLEWRFRSLLVSERAASAEQI